MYCAPTEAQLKQNHKNHKNRMVIISTCLLSIMDFYRKISRFFQFNHLAFTLNIFDVFSLSMTHISSIQLAPQSTYEIAVKFKVNFLEISKSNTRVLNLILVFDLVVPRELTFALTAISQVLWGTNYILLISYANMIESNPNETKLTNYLRKVRVYIKIERLYKSSGAHEKV